MWRILRGDVALPLPRLASVLQAARSAEFCGRTVLFTTHTQPSAARRSRTEYRAGLEPLISPRPVCIDRGSLPHCPNGGRGHDTLREGARCQWEAAPGACSSPSLIDSHRLHWRPSLVESLDAAACSNSAPKRTRRRPSCRPRRLPPTRRGSIFCHCVYDDSARGGFASTGVRDHICI